MTSNTLGLAGALADTSHRFYARGWVVGTSATSAPSSRGIRFSSPSRPAGDDDRGQRVASIVAYAEWLMERDCKAFGLKALQGHITKGGYENGSLRGEVYPDVPVAFARWHDAGIPVAIFSSGSVLAQQMIFRTTTHGDLSRWIHTFFDTSVGSKRSAESYRRIASALGCAPSRVLFISDVAAELDAAREAGCETRLCVRDVPAAGAAQPSSDHTTIHDFSDVM